MSNQAVGNVYQTIIDEVVNSSRVDFEESGVEEAVLEELRQVWQRKLTQLDVASFPWDPKPDPPPNPVSAPPPQPVTPAHTQAQFTSQLPLPTGAPLDGLPQINSIKPEAGFVKQEPNAPIKQEPGLQQAALPSYQNFNGMEKASVAASRAAKQLQAQYGVRAAGSINALQDRIGTQQHQAPQQPAQQQQQQQPLQGQPPLSHAQADGAGDALEEFSDDESDLEAILLRRGTAGNMEELGRVEVDRILHKQIAAKARSMEGGGLMLSLKEANKQQAKSKVSRKSKGKERLVAGFDGGDDDDDDDDVDEDAINSDLDDSDEAGEDDEVDDEGLGHIMLCMYDKVQRVKNKWKCTLKDGVLTVNGKEYVFTKATGEYEW